MLKSLFLTLVIGFSAVRADDDDETPPDLPFNSAAWEWRADLPQQEQCLTCEVLMARFHFFTVAKLATSDSQKLFSTPKEMKKQVCVKFSNSEAHYKYMCEEILDKHIIQAFDIYLGKSTEWGLLTDIREIQNHHHSFCHSIEACDDEHLMIDQTPSATQCGACKNIAHDITEFMSRYKQVKASYIREIITQLFHFTRLRRTQADAEMELFTELLELEEEEREMTRLLQLFIHGREHELERKLCTQTFDACKKSEL